MGFFNKLFNKKQQTTETVKENNTEKNVNQSKVYIDKDMAKEIVNMLQTFGEDKIKNV